MTSLWRFLQPLLFGQVRANRSAITAHYDIDPEFFLSFLDPKTPCYTQGVYLSPDETRDAATLRKFDYCYERCELKPGDHILEIGPGRVQLPPISPVFMGRRLRVPERQPRPLSNDHSISRWQSDRLTTIRQPGAVSATACPCASPAVSRITNTLT